MDLPRVLRVPGFYHHKDEAFLVECIKFNPELRYTQEQLSEVLPQVVEDKSDEVIGIEIKTRDTQKGLVLVGKPCQFLQYCKRNAKKLSEPDWYAMISNFAIFEGGEKAIHQLSKPYAKYDFEQTQKKIDHFLSQIQNP